MSNKNIEPDQGVHVHKASRRHSYRTVELEVPRVARAGAGYVDCQQSGRGTPKLSTKSDFVYVNTAYVGSVNSLNSNVNPQRLQEPPTSVIREQYWACSKWPRAQRVLAIAVGVLLGAVVSLVVILYIGGDTEHDINGIFSAQRAPD